MRRWYRRKDYPRSYRLLKRELMRLREAESNREAIYEEEFGSMDIPTIEEDQPNRSKHPNIEK